MPLYEFKCQSCRTISTTMDYGVVPDCQVCKTAMNKVFSFYAKPMFKGHFNPSVGKYVSSQREFDEALKIAGADATERTGIPHNYVSTEVGDADAFGVSEEAREENVRLRYGQDIAPESLTA